MARGRLLGLIALTMLAFAPRVALGSLAGTFQLLENQSSETKAPDTSPPCATVANSATALTGNGEIDTEAKASSQAKGTDSSCDESSGARATAQGIFKLAPDTGSPGDELSLCAKLQWVQEVLREGDASAASHVHASVEVRHSASSIPVLRILGRSLSTTGEGEGPEDRLREFSCVREFTATIGDTLFVSAGVVASTHLGGVGESFSESEVAQVVVQEGACPTKLSLCPLEAAEQAPALSNLGLGVVCVLLALIGGGLVRLRPARGARSRRA